MDKQQQQSMARALRQGGMPAWRVERTVGELMDHYQDIHEEALAAGLSADEARVEANRRVGELHALAEHFLLNDELCDWPLLAGIENHAFVAQSALLKRWSMAVCCSAIGTGGLLLALHLIIVVR